MARRLVVDCSTSLNNNRWNSIDPMALVVSKFKRASSTSASDMLNSDNMLGLSQLLGGSGWISGMVNTLYVQIYIINSY